MPLRFHSTNTVCPHGLSRAPGSTAPYVLRTPLRTVAASSSGFRAGTTSAVPFAKSRGGGGGAVLGWQPSPRLMQYRAVRYLVPHVLPIATYQLTLELGLTAVFGLLLYNEACTPREIVDAIERWHYPFMSLISLEGCTYSEGIHVGPRTLKPDKLTAAHTAHNIASGLLPLQVVFMACTYPLLLKGYRTFAARRCGAAAVAAAASASAAPAHRAAAAAGEAAQRTSPRPPTRRPSYVRPSMTRK